MVIAQTVQIASLGMADSLILMVMALVVFGPRRLPQIGRQIGKLMYEFRKASNDFKFQMEEELRNSEEADRRKKEEERLRALALAAPAPSQVEASTASGTTATDTAGTETAEKETLAAETLNPAAIYDNGPVASAQGADMQSVPRPPIVRPPSIGETVAAARGWSEKYEQARLAQASKIVGGPAAAAEESDTSRVIEPGTTPPARPAIEATLADNASTESVPETAAQDASTAVNHHG